MPVGDALHAENAAIFSDDDKFRCAGQKNLPEAGLQVEAQSNGLLECEKTILFNSTQFVSGFVDRGQEI
jgi:hypothetical protein